MQTQLYQRLLIESHSAIQNGYNIAIQHYNQQKKEFIQNLNFASQKASQITINDFMERLNQEVEQEIDSELDEKFNEMFKLIEEDFLQNIEKKLMGRSAAAIKLKQKFKSKQSIAEEKDRTTREFYKSMTNDIELFLLSIGRDKKFITQFINNTTNEAIQSNLYGYLRRAVFERLNIGKNFSINRQHYKTSLKGYYKEEMLTDALSKILEQYNLSAVSSGTETNQKGQQIKYDIIIADQGTIKANTNSSGELMLSPIVNALDSLGNTKSAIGSSNRPIIAGVQSKSWIEPFKSPIAKKRNWSEFGGASIYAPNPNSTESYYWHAGVRNAMSNLIDIVGRGNIIFSTGSEVYWTADLLTQFKNEQYVLAFYKRKGRKEGDAQKIVSTNVGMMFHEDA